MKNIFKSESLIWGVIFVIFISILSIDYYRKHTLSKKEIETLSLFSEEHKSIIKKREIAIQKKFIQRFLRTKDSYSLVNSFPPNCLENSHELAYLCYCKDGYFRDLERSSCVKLPENSFSIVSKTEIWQCEDGYVKSLDNKKCIEIPLNAHAVTSDTDVWICNSGYKEAGNTCIKNTISSYSFQPSFDYVLTEDDFYDGYNWASYNDINSFYECESEYGVGDAEDGCNEYVKENYTGNSSFYGYECTEDCSGHERGYEWAEENYIDDTWDCDGYSDSFIEGCEAYVDENY